MPAPFTNKINMRKFIITATALLLLAYNSNAGTSSHFWEDPNEWWYDHFVTDDHSGPRFNANEISLELGPTFYDSQGGGKTALGGGIGLNYFITREIGVGLDLNMSADGGKFVDHIEASGIFRWPIQDLNIAPYGFVGFGRLTEPRWDWFAHVGLGVEYRFNPSTGVFTDLRYQIADHTDNRVFVRWGFRVTL